MNGIVNCLQWHTACIFLRARHARFRPIQALLKGYFKSHEHNISLKNIAHYIIICLKRGAETAID